MAPKPGSDAPGWTTSITAVEADRILVRGYPVDELMGRVSFGDAIYLLLTGELPSPSIARLIGALLTGFIDHGVTPSAAISRESARAGAPLEAAVAAGLLGLDRQPASGVPECRKLLDQALDLAGSSLLLASAATDLVEHLVQTDRIPPPGFGPQPHMADPRVLRLLQMALELEVDALYTQCLRAMAHALSRHPALADEPLPINLEGAMAAVCGDLGLDAGVAEALLIVSRVPGLTAHALEARAHAAAGGDPRGTVRYDGPGERRLKDRR
jgi:citrate synthase